MARHGDYRLDLRVGRPVSARQSIGMGGEDAESALCRVPVTLSHGDDLVKRRRTNVKPITKSPMKPTRITRPRRWLGTRHRQDWGTFLYRTRFRAHGATYRQPHPASGSQGLRSDLSPDGVVWPSPMSAEREKVKLTSGYTTCCGHDDAPRASARRPARNLWPRWAATSSTRDPNVSGEIGQWFLYGLPSVTAFGVVGVLCQILHECKERIRLADEKPHCRQEFQRTDGSPLCLGRANDRTYR